MKYLISATCLKISLQSWLATCKSLQCIPGVDVLRLYEELLRLGIKTVLHRPGNGADAKLSFLISAKNSPADISDCATALAQAWKLARYKPNRNEDAIGFRMIQPSFS